MDDCRDVCHCRPMCMPYMIKQTDAEEVDGARVLELMGELSDPVARSRSGTMLAFLIKRLRGFLLH